MKPLAEVKRLESARDNRTHYRHILAGGHSAFWMEYARQQIAKLEEEFPELRQPDESNASLAFRRKRAHAP